MKMLLLTLMVFMVTALPSIGQNIQNLYEEGRALYNAGHLEQAREKLKIVAARNPNHVPTRAMLAQIQQALGSQNTNLKSSYEKIIIEKVEFENVALAEAIEAVRIHTRKATNDKVSPNIIIKGEELGERKVSINLAGVPLSEVLNYLAQLSDTRLSYEKSAVFFVPNTAVAK